MNLKIRKSIKKRESPNLRLVHHKIPMKNGHRLNMEFTTFVRKPFVVEAVEVTADNIADVARYVGDLREEDDGTQYILVDRRLVPNIARVYAGFYMTKMGKNVRCYSRKIFKDQFIEEDENVKPWVEYMGSKADIPDTPQV